MTGARPEPRAPARLRMVPPAALSAAQDRDPGAPVRYIEGVEAHLGHRRPVYAQGKGESSATLRGHVVIEDLTGVLDRISSRTGPNGPQGEVTQWILSQAARHLAERFSESVEYGTEGRSLPKGLSALVGHEPFARTYLDVSVHQMLRRWPQASDWYDDLLAYVLRPQLVSANLHEVVGEFQVWTGLRLGDFVRELTRHQVTRSETDALYQLSDIVEAMWPDHPVVKASRVKFRKAIVDLWGPLFVLGMANYGLRLRPGVQVEGMIWTFQALASWEIRERRVLADLPWRVDPVTGRDEPTCSHALLVFLAGALQDLDGRFLSVEELADRRATVAGFATGS